MAARTSVTEMGNSKEGGSFHFIPKTWTILLLTLVVVLAIVIPWMYTSDVEGLTGAIRTVSVGSFNTLMIPMSSGFAERKEMLLQTIQHMSGAPDILCLQEVFKRSVAKEIVESVSSVYPYHASFEDLEEVVGSRPACTPQEASIATACQSQFCSNLTSLVQLFNCTLLHCFRSSLLSQSCQSCLIYEAGIVEDTHTHCSTTILASDYTAPYGVLLLSRHSLSNIKTADFLDPPFRTFLPRGYITAEVEELGYPVLCTHLTSDLVPLGVDYFGPPQFGHFSEQQANEIKVIHEFVENNKNFVLLGDFNHGPAAPGISWELPLNYGLMTARGLLSVGAVFCGQCTYCSDNVLGGHVWPDVLLDHIYIPSNRISSVKSTERFFDDIQTPISKLPLSDHFGVRAELFVTSYRRAMCHSSSTIGKPFVDLEDIDQRTQDFCFTL